MADSSAEKEEALLLLRNRGLIVSPRGSELTRFHIRRPSGIEGNRREDYQRDFCGFRDGEMIVLDTLDAPLGVLEQSPEPGAWLFRVWDYAPGPGPGDFEREYESFDEAVSAVLDYYFGDPAWMCAEWDAFRLSRQRRGLEMP